jgi:LAS superfamily LD-carboxypeptidase LdcB
MGKQHIPDPVPPTNADKDQPVGKTLSPPDLDIMASSGMVMGHDDIMNSIKGIGNTGAMHQGIADTYRRWSGKPTTGEKGFDGEGGNSDFHMTHMGGLRQEPMDANEIETRIKQESARQLDNASSLIRPEYLHKLIAERDAHPDFKAVYDAIVQEAQAAKDFSGQNTVIDRRVSALFPAAELEFIHDDSLSSIDLLPAERAAHFKGIKWEHEDFPGGKTGKNERQANKLADELSAIRPERRANSTEHAVVTKSKYNSDKALRTYIDKELVPVPDFTAAAPGESVPPKQPKGHRMNRHAVAAYVQMRDDALKEGVVLIIGASHRSQATAEKNAEKADNSSAVAAFSVHTLGLAMDLHLSHGSTKYQEISTRPFSNVVDMRSSPAHKWLFLRGAQYGFFPLQNESWHWEYNPVGFKEQLMEEFKASKAAAKKP